MHTKTKFKAQNGLLYILKKLDNDTVDIIPQLQRIIDSRPVQQWMDDVKGLTTSDYYEWLIEKNTDLFGIFHDNSLVGFIYYYPTKNNNEREISYARLDTARRGFMTDAIKLSLILIKNEQKNLTRVIAQIDKGNTPSLSVITKSGFKKNSNSYVYEFSS